MIYLTNTLLWSDSFDFTELFMSSPVWNVIDLNAVINLLSSFLVEFVMMKLCKWWRCDIQNNLQWPAAQITWVLSWPKMSSRMRQSVKQSLAISKPVIAIARSSESPRISEAALWAENNSYEYRKIVSNVAKKRNNLLNSNRVKNPYNNNNKKKKKIYQGSIPKNL